MIATYYDAVLNIHNKILCNKIAQDNSVWEKEG